MDDGYFNKDHCVALAKAIDSLTQAVQAGLDWFKSQADLATKQDLKEMEKRVLDAIESGAHDDPKIAQALAEATARLKAHTDALDAAAKAAPGAPP